MSAYPRTTRLLRLSAAVASLGGLAVSTGCGGSIGGEAVATAQPLQIRIVQAVDPVGSRTCATAALDVPATGDLCDREGRNWYRLAPSVTRSTVENATATQSNGQWVVVFELNDEDGRAFADLTTNNVGRQVALVVGSRVVSAPAVSSPVTNGIVQMSANFTAQDARDLAKQLKPS